MVAGARPVAGLLTAIIGGLVAPIFGGSRLTVFGPAAGLAPVLFTFAIAFGGGEGRNYPVVLFAAIVLAGIIQVVWAILKLPRFAKWISPSAVAGMLCAIGLIVIVKQIPIFLGSRFEAHEFFDTILETPYHILSMKIEVFVVGVSSLGLMFCFTKTRWAKTVPVQMAVAVFGLVLTLVLGLESKHLIQLPDNPLDYFREISLPDWEMFSSGECWKIAGIVALILSIESLATVTAIDAIDPEEYHSNPNRVLLVDGVINIICGLVGALPGIRECVRSFAGVESGATNRSAAFCNSCFLLVALVAGSSAINFLPKVALGAIIIGVGLQLCRKSWVHMRHLGSEQLVAFFATIAVIVSVDLAYGIVVGVAVSKLIAMLKPAMAKLVPDYE